MTFIAAPALLTNATSVLALSTTQRMLHTRDSMRQLLAKAETQGSEQQNAKLMVEHVNRIEAQGGLLLNALRSIYLALGAFSGATLITLLGAALAPFQGAVWFQALAVLGLAVGLTGVGCLIFGSIRLFQATQLSLINIREEATQARAYYRSAGEH